jgi:hypothetical protein
MADQNSRQFQNFLEAAQSSLPNDVATSATTTTDDIDMDYEPVTDESDDADNQVFLDGLLADGDVEDNEADEGWQNSINGRSLAHHPCFRRQCVVYGGDRGRD